MTVDFVAACLFLSLALLFLARVCERKKVHVNRRILLF